MMPLDIPVIETDRLILRGPKESDLEPMVAFGASERARFLGGPYDREQAWRNFLGSIGHWVWRGYGMWWVEDRMSARVAGRVGMLFHDGREEPELAWHVYAGFEGKGLAFEAAEAARRFVAQHFGLDGVISLIDPTNTRSLALAERLGASYERDGVYLGKPAQIWRHPRQIDTKGGTHV